MTSEGNQKFDAIIIGSGQGGMPLSRELAGAGWKVALVERSYLGGTCINYGCTPTKTLVASARAAYTARRSAEYGVFTGEVVVDQAAVRQRKRDTVADFRAGVERRSTGTEGLTLIRGTARFSGPRTLMVQLNEGGEVNLEADKIFIDTGGRPRIPDLPGLAAVPYLDSTSIMELDETPEHLLVLGGGYIGVEFGQMFRRFGSRVTIIQRGDQLLAREDEDVAAEVLNILQEDGIEVLLDNEARRVEKDAGGALHLVVSGQEGEQTIRGSHLLVATGRTPNSEELNLEQAGVETDAHGYIRTNGRLETSVPGIYALGDVKGGPAFTHISYDDYRILRDNLLNNKPRSSTNRLVPYVVFMDPQLGRVGLTEKEARKQGREIRVAKIPMSWVARAIEVAETRGLMKAVVDAETERIIGAAVLGIQGGEIMAMLEIAMMGSLPYTALADGIFTHPSLSEALNTLFANFES